MSKPTRKLVAEAHALREQIAVLEAEYERRALVIKAAGPGVYSVPGAAAIVSEYESSRTDWAAVVRAAKVPPRTVARYTTKKPSRRLDWSAS